MGANLQNLLWGITKNLDRHRHQARRGPFLGIIYCEFMKISRLSSFPDELWSIFATVKALDLSVYIFCNDPSSWRFLWWSVPNRLSFPLMVLSDCFVCRSRHDSRDENRNMYLDPATTDSWTLWVRSCFWLCLCVFLRSLFAFVSLVFSKTCKSSKNGPLVKKAGPQKLHRQISCLQFYTAAHKPTKTCFCIDFVCFLLSSICM